MGEDRDIIHKLKMRYYGKGTWWERMQERYPAEAQYYIQKTMVHPLIKDLGGIHG